MVRLIIEPYIYIYYNAGHGKCKEKIRLFIYNAPVIIKCTETHMSRLCIFLFISTP